VWRAGGYQILPNAQQRAYMLLFEIERERAKKSEQRPKLGNANADKIPVLGALAIRIHIREQNKVSADPDGEKKYRTNVITPPCFLAHSLNGQ
jgi:hypothetical protein